MKMTLKKSPHWGRWILTTIAVSWFLILILVPVGGLLQKLLTQSFSEIYYSLQTATAARAFLLTAKVTFLAVVINMVMGILMAKVIVTQKFRGKLFIEGLIDLPFAISPVVVGFMLVILFGPYGWLGGLLESVGVKVIYATPGIVIATVFVTLPFVAKEVIPVYQQAGLQSEEAAQVLGASQWQAFWWVTLPTIKWGVIYGVTLALARSLGEFGAVLVVSGSIINKTETATLFIHQQFTDFNYTSAYTASLLIAAMAFIILIGIEWLAKSKKEA